MKKLGFGCMRLPMNGEEVDLVELSKMVDVFMERGFTYFDTAKVYIQGKSELAIKECLVKRYPRESYIIADKLSGWCMKKPEEVIPFFNSQLESLGVDYIDYYLLHAYSERRIQEYEGINAIEQCLKLKEEGKIKHLGFSFHGSAAYLDEFLTLHPEFEFVQIQFNYLDYDSYNVQSRLCYEVCRKHKKDIMIMEPVKGGELVKLPQEANEILKAFNNGSNASYAIRFAASYEGVVMVLSGMSNMEQMLDNLSYMEEFVPLNEKEMEACFKVADIIKKNNLIACTGCKYCVDGCPKKIMIPSIFAIKNAKILNENYDPNAYSQLVLTSGKASDCIKCGKCEIECPQHLPIREYLEKLSKEFDR